MMPIRKAIRIAIVKMSAACFLLCLCGNGAFAADPIIGFTEPTTTIELAASETGTLSKLNIKRGDRVAAAQVLGSLDVEVLEANRMIAQAKLDTGARLKAAEIRLKQASQNFEQLQTLRAEGLGGRRELQMSQAEFELAETDVEAVKEEIQLSSLELRRIEAEIRRRSLVSPINGIVSDVHRDVGEFVAASDPNVLTIVDLSELRIRFYPETKFAEPLVPGDMLSVRFVHSNKVVNAKVEFIAPVINADSNTIQIDVLLDNSLRKLRSGRRCELLRTVKSPVTQPSIGKLSALRQASEGRRQ